MLDSLPIFAKLTLDITQCDCCMRKGLKRTICIDSADFNPIHLGVICCSQWFNVNLSGNPYKALKRIQQKLKELDNEEIEDIINQIKEENQNK